MRWKAFSTLWNTNWNRWVTVPRDLWKWKVILNTSLDYDVIANKFTWNRLDITFVMILFSCFCANISTLCNMVIKSYGFINHCFESQSTKSNLCAIPYPSKSTVNLEYNLLVLSIFCYDECPSRYCECFYNFSRDMDIIFCGWMSVSNGQAVVRR